MSAALLVCDIADFAGECSRDARRELEHRGVAALASSHGAKMHLRAALPRVSLCLRAARRYLSTPSWDPPLNATLSRHVDALVGRHAELQAALERGAFDVAAAKELARLEPVVVARAALDEAADGRAGCTS